MQTVPEVLQKFVPNSQGRTSARTAKCGIALKLWAFSVTARRSVSNGRDTTVTVNHTVAMLHAENDDEARGKGYRIAKKLFPQQSGWTDHNVAISDSENVVTFESVTLILPSY